ncbi:glycoside hydrolase family 2 TIM barrel-domain containing protein [Streptomyces bluensis]|uniref:glycoside hydrolase family 2 TIM barrel-domain containing protein n=1 Tax=Streptomyces bluensis TaxID=33897 RepID=UPI00331F4675
MTRRQALRLGAVGAGSLALDAGFATAADGAGSPPAGGPPRERSFDEGWRFFRGQATGAQDPAFDDGSWRSLDLPHDWSIEDLPHAPAPDGGATSDPSLLVPKEPPAEPSPPRVIGPFDPENSEGGGSTGYTVGGIGWYRKHFTLPDPDGEDDLHHELRFDGVYQNADIWLNGVHLGFHPYGYTSFAYDLTPHVRRRGTNVLAVRVDNTGRNGRWYSGSGIYRHTWLTTTGPVRIPLWGVHVSTPVVGERRSVARVEVSLANLGEHPSSASVRVSVRDPRGRVVATAQKPAQDLPSGTTATARLDLPVRQPELWSMDTPNLYSAHTEVLVGGRPVDTLTTTFGIRSLVWDGEAGFLLNGEPVEIMGGNVHHDHGPLGAVALDRSEERRVEILKEAGFNSIRTAHNPPTPALLDVCDRLGMLVMDEIFDVWDTGKNPQDYSVHFAEWWERDLRGTVLRDRNHPSVVMWSLGNEISDNTSGHRGAEMAQALRSLDRTRPITLGGGSTHSANDPSWDYVDVDVGDVHYNANGKTYGPMHEAHPDKAMTHNETFPATPGGAATAPERSMATFTVP